MLKFSTLAENTERTGGGDNFLVLRFIAAYAVLYAHSYHMIGLGADPLTPYLNIYTGTLAVLVFFGISGFFIAQSFSRRPFLEFIEARALRLLPGLVVCSVLTAYVMGPIVTSLPLWDYLTHPETWNYVKVNSSLASVTYSLPGVFQNQHDSTVNGSLWTLPSEARAYLGLAVFGALGLLGRQKACNAAFILFLTINALWPTLFDAIPNAINASRVYFCFIVGALFYANRYIIPIHPLLLLAALAILITGRGETIHPIRSAFALVYCIFYFAYRLPVIPWFKGDYSYGLYLYAYPVTQFIIYLKPDISIAGLLAGSSVLSFALAFASWHWVEKPALNAKGTLQKLIVYVSAWREAPGRRVDSSRQ